MRFVQGQISFNEFEVICNNKPEVWQWLQSLLPSDIKSKDSSFWNEFPWTAERLEFSNFSVQYAAMAFGIDYFTYNIIRDIVLYAYPQTEWHLPSKGSEDDLLEKIGLWYIGGKEVEDIVCDILEQNAELPQKIIKEKFKQTFHLVPRKTPRWVQEPEWPALDGQPMYFVSQSHEGDRYEYVFADENGLNIRIIEQFA